MPKGLRLALISATLAASLLAGQSSIVLGASALSFANSYATEGPSFNGGSVTYQAGSGTFNYLRATTQADVLGAAYQVVSVRQGFIDSTAAKYTGANSDTITFRLTGTFSRDVSGGFSLFNGVGSRHVISWAVRDVNAGHVIGQWTIADEEVLCGGLVWPIGGGGCNGSTSETYASTFARTIGGGNVVSGHSYRIEVSVGTILSAGGYGLGIQGKTTARDMSGSMSW